MLTLTLRRAWPRTVVPAIGHVARVALCVNPRRHVVRLGCAWVCVVAPLCRLLLFSRAVVGVLSFLVVFGIFVVLLCFWPWRRRRLRCKGAPHRAGDLAIGHVARVVCVCPRRHAVPFLALCLCCGRVVVPVVVVVVRGGRFLCVSCSLARLLLGVLLCWSFLLTGFGHQCQCVGCATMHMSLCVRRVCSPTYLPWRVGRSSGIRLTVFARRGGLLGDGMVFVLCLGLSSVRLLECSGRVPCYRDSRARRFLGACARRGSSAQRL